MLHGVVTGGTTPLIITEVSSGLKKIARAQVHCELLCDCIGHHHSDGKHPDDPMEKW